MNAGTVAAPTQKAFKVAWSTAAASQFFVTWGDFGSVTRLAWTILEPRWLAPVVQSGAMPPRLPYAGQAAEVLRQMRENPDAASLWREIEHLEHYIRRVDTGEVDAFGM